MLLFFACCFGAILASLFVADEVIRYQRRKHLAALGGGNSYAIKQINPGADDESQPLRHSGGHSL